MSSNIIFWKTGLIFVLFKYLRHPKSDIAYAVCSELWDRFINKLKGYKISPGKELYNEVHYVS